MGPDLHGIFLEATTQHLLLRAGARAHTVEITEALTLRKLVKAIELLEDAYELGLGVTEFRHTYSPGWAKVGVTEHPLAEGRGYERGELATIDSTPEPDTIHPTDDPADADRIVTMARRDQRTEDLLEGLVEQQTRFFAQLSNLLSPDEQGGARTPRYRRGPPDAVARSRSRRCWACRLIPGCRRWW